MSVYDDRLECFLGATQLLTLRRGRPPQGSGKHCSLDHLVCRGQQRFRDGEAEGFGGLEVDDQIEFRGLDYRQVSWLLMWWTAPAPGIEVS